MQNRSGFILSVLLGFRVGNGPQTSPHLVSNTAEGGIIKQALTYLIFVICVPLFQLVIERSRFKQVLKNMLSNLGSGPVHHYILKNLAVKQTFLEKDCINKPEQ